LENCQAAVIDDSSISPFMSGQTAHATFLVFFSLFM
jgi:hypothetical protein